MKERLQKVLASCGVCSRRQAEEYIKQGKVTVDGQIVREMGVKVDPEQQKIEFEGKPLTLAEQKVYLLLNKPKGYVTTLRDPQNRPIVTSLLPRSGLRLFPVGRLDQDTEGALILTNDGDFAQRIQHPSFEVTKTYSALVAGTPSKEEIARLEQGISLEGRRTAPARLKMINPGPPATLEITIHEGRKRQVRKMFAAINHPVLELKRIAYGRLLLGSLPSGKYRTLTANELNDFFFKKNSLYNRQVTGIR